MAKDNPSWFKNPAYIINDRNINSAISSPAHNEVLDLSQTEYTIKGYTYNGGRRITRVEVSFDYGTKWEITELEQPAQPTPYGRFWCRSFWKMKVDTKRMLETKEIAVRA